MARRRKPLRITAGTDYYPGHVLRARAKPEGWAEGDPLEPIDLSAYTWAATLRRGDATVDMAVDTSSAGLGEVRSSVTAELTDPMPRGLWAYRLRSTDLAGRVRDWVTADAVVSDP